jgi:hypothetical protein
MRQSHSLYGTAACAVALFALPARAQNPPPWCIPGTTLCAGGNGQGQGNGGAAGGGTLGGSAGGQVTPQGADGHANGTANGNGQANGQANGGANGGVVVPSPPPTPAPAVSNVPPAPLPLPPAPVVYASPRSNGDGGRGASAAFAGCALAQVGLFSGFKAGGCLGVRLPGHAFSIDLDLQILGGGTIPGVDIVPAVSVVVPISDGDAYDRWNIRIGIPLPGAWVSTRDRDTGLVFRLPQVGIGYDVQVSSTVALRLLDVRAQLELRSKDVDTQGHWLEPAVQVGMGLWL